MEQLTTRIDDIALSDEDILRRSTNEPWLYTFLVDRYEAPFLRKVRAILRDPRDCEEVVLDAFTKIYVHADSFTPKDGAKFSSWAYRILLNTAYTRYQKMVKDGQRFAVLDPEFEAFIAEKGDIVTNETRDGIERILARLPEHFSYVLRLHYLERWSHEDIARETKEAVGTVKARIHRAKAAFRRESKPTELDVLW